MSAINGVLSAIFSSAFMASQRTVARRGFVDEKDTPPSVAVFITQCVALLYFGILVLFLGKFSSIFELSLKTIISFGVGGILHYVLGRTFSYRAYKYIGVNVASPFVAMSNFYSVIFGIFLLKENINSIKVLGLTLIFIGILVLLFSKSRFDTWSHIDRKNLRKGLLAAIGAGLSFGSSPLLIRIGLTSGGSPITGPFISYIFSFALYTPILLFFGSGKKMRQMNINMSKYFLLSGFLVNSAHLLRFLAFSFAPISLVSPLLSCNELFSILFTRILIKKYEIFTFPIIIGLTLSASGVILISLSSIS